MKKILIAIVFAVISTSSFASAYWQEKMNTIAGMANNLAGQLYQDRKDLGLTDEERVNIKNWYMATAKEIHARCGYNNPECSAKYFDKVYDDLRAFEQQKMAEKEKRMANRPMPSLSGTMKGQAAQPAQKKSYIISDAEAKKRYQESQKVLDSIPESNSEEFEGD